MILYTFLSALCVLLLVVNRKNYWHDNQAVKLHLVKDSIIVLFCFILSFASIELHKIKKARHAPFEVGMMNEKDISQINFLDHSFAGNWDVEAKSYGKVIVNVSIYLVPISLLLYIGNIKRRLALLLIYSEGYVLTESFTGLAKGVVYRLRPFAYIPTSSIQKFSQDSKEELLEDLANYDISNSFFSGDVSISAFGLVFFALSFGFFYPESRFKTLVWILSFLGIMLTCYFRVQSGKHFPTDVIIGAVVGSLIAWGILKAHRSLSPEGIQS